MGSSHPKYFSTAEAIELIGSDTFQNLTAQLKGICGQSIDFSSFLIILRNNFDKLV